MSKSSELNPIISIAISLFFIGFIAWGILIVIGKMFVEVSNTMIDYTTPFGFSIISSLLIALVSFPTLKAQSGLLTSLVLSSRKKLIVAGVILSLLIIGFSLSIKFSKIDKIEASIVKYQKESRAWSASIK